MLLIANTDHGAAQDQTSKCYLVVSVIQQITVSSFIVGQVLDQTSVCVKQQTLLEICTSKCFHEVKNDQKSVSRGCTLTLTTSS